MSNRYYILDLNRIGEPTRFIITNENKSRKNYLKHLVRNTEEKYHCKLPIQLNIIDVIRIIKSIERHRKKK